MFTVDVKQQYNNLHLQSTYWIPLFEGNKLVIRVLFLTLIQHYIRNPRGNAFKHQKTLVKAQKIQFYATEPFREDQFIHCQNTVFLIHVNTDNDNSFSLFDCLLNVLILTFSV